jgi:hypothetical protein
LARKARERIGRLAVAVQEGRVPPLSSEPLRWRVVEALCNPNESKAKSA